jgi:hypothetical protein
MTATIAAAGIAEAAWAMAACVMTLGFGVVGVLTLFAFALRSRALAAFATVLLLLATLFFQPWHCFWPFEEAAYADPDVESAAGMFQTVGVIWVAVCVACAGSLLFAFLAPRKGLPLAATRPEGSAGLPEPEPRVRSTGIQVAPEASGVTLREGIFRTMRKTGDT